MKSLRWSAPNYTLRCKSPRCLSSPDPLRFAPGLHLVSQGGVLGSRESLAPSTLSSCCSEARRTRAGATGCPGPRFLPVAVAHGKQVNGEGRRGQMGSPAPSTSRDLAAFGGTYHGPHSNLIHMHLTKLKLQTTDKERQRKYPPRVFQKYAISISHAHPRGSP